LAPGVISSRGWLCWLSRVRERSSFWFLEDAAANPVVEDGLRLAHEILAKDYVNVVKKGG